MTIGVVFALVALVLPAIPASAATTAATVPPGRPTHVTATAGTLSATVSWQASGEPATSFTATSNPGGITATVGGTATSATVTGLGYGLAYTFTVAGTNSLGTGLASAPSNTVTPDPPGGPYHQGFAIPLLNRNITAGSPFATNLGVDPVHLPGLSAVVLNLTASQATVSTAVQVVVNNQVVQTISLAAGQVQSSLVVVAVPAQLSQAAIQVTTGTAHVQLDFVGYYTGPKTLRNHGGQLVMIRPAILLNTSVAAGSTTNIPVLGQGGVPSTGVAEVLVNVTASGAAATGSFALLPSGGSLLGTTTLGFAAGQTTANRAIVALPANGSISLVDRGAAANARVDVLGWFTDGTDPSAVGGLYSPLASARLVDTAGNGGPLPAGGDLTFAVLGHGGVPALSSTAPPTSVLLQVTAVAPAGAGSISISGTAVIVFAAGQTVSGVTLVHLASDGSATLTVTGAATNVTVDVVGYYSGDLIVPGSTKVLTPALLAAITGIGADNSVTFAPGTQVSPFIQLNDVIAAGISPTTPQGFLFRVLSISTLPSGAIVLGTRIALLPEAVTAFVVDLVVAPTNSAARFGAHSNGASSLLDCFIKYPFVAPANTSIDPNCPTLAIASSSQSLHLFPAPWADLAITDLEIQVIPHVHLEWDPWTNLTLFKAAFAFSEGIRVALEMSVTKDLVLNNPTKPLYDQNFQTGPTEEFAIGPVPVTVTPTVTLAVTFEANISVGVGITYHFDKYVQVAESWDGSQFHTSSQATLYVNGFDPPVFTANAEAKLTFHVGPGLTFYRFEIANQVAGLTAGVDFNRYVKGTASVVCTIQPSCAPANPWFTLSVGECIGVFMDLRLILFNRFFSQDLACIDTVLLAAPGAHVGITITPSPATVARFKIQRFHATVTNGTAGVSWTVVGGAANGTLSNTLITTDADYTAPARAGTYFLRAASIDDPTSTTTATITVLADPPGPPTGVTAAVAGPDSATVSWTAPSDDGGSPITAYHVLVSPGGAVVDTGNTLSATVPGLTSGSTYTFTVTATNKGGVTSAPSLASAAITIGVSAPGAPTAVTAVPVTVTTPQGSAVVSWTAPTLDGGSPITAYHVLVSLAGGQVDTGLGIDTGNVLSVTVPNLNAGSTYTFQVTATNQAGLTSVPSDASALITIPIPDIVIVTPANFDYGLVPAGQTSVHTFTLHASSTADITISSMLLLSARAADFMVQADHCTGQVVLASGTCTFDVLYTSRTQGYSWTQVLVYYANATNPLLVVSAFVRGHSPLPLVSNFEPVSGAQMLDLLHGWAMDLHGLLATVDGGKTWTRQLAPSGTKFTGNFRFADASHGMALGCVLITFCNDTNILGTSDGGTTWTLLRTIPTLEGRGISVADATHAWVAGAQDGFEGPPMWATIDGGLTWNRQVLPDPTQTTCATFGGLVSSEVDGVRFIDPLHGWAMGSSECQQSGTLAVLSQMTIAWSTSDGGATWTAHDTGLNTFFVFASWRLQVLSATQMRVLVNGTATTILLTTNDGGATFSQLPLPGPPTDVSFWDANNAVLITDNGRIAWTSSDGGLTWTTTPAAPARYLPTLNNDPALYRLVEAVDASHWWAFGQVVYLDGSPVRGVIEATADAGSSWLAQLVGALN